MPALAARSREQIRFSAGSEVGVVETLTTSADGETDGSTLKVNSLIEGADDQNGKHVRFTDGDNDGENVRASDSSVASNVTTITLVPVAGAKVVSGVGFELWDELFPPSRIDKFITSCEIEIMERGYTLHTQDEGMFGNMKQAKYDRPSGFVEISAIRVHTHVPGETVLESSTAWDELVDTDVTAGQDLEDFREGNAAAKFTVAAAISDGDIIATNAIASLDMSRRDTVEFWFWSNVDLAAADLALLLDDTASCASPLETIEFPSITARTWTRVKLTLANPELDTAIISVGLEYNANTQESIFKISRITGLTDSERQWSDPMSKELWWPNIEDGKIEFTYAGRMLISGRRLQVTGRKLPTVMSTDASTSEIEVSILSMLVRERMYQALMKVGDKDERALNRGSAALERTRFENTFYPPTPDIDSIPVV